MPAYGLIRETVIGLKAHEKKKKKKYQEEAQRQEGGEESFTERI